MGLSKEKIPQIHEPVSINVRFPWDVSSWSSSWYLARITLACRGRISSSSRPGPARCRSKSTCWSIGHVHGWGNSLDAEKGETSLKWWRRIWDDMCKQIHLEPGHLAHRKFSLDGFTQKIWDGWPKTTGIIKRTILSEDLFTYWYSGIYNNAGLSKNVGKTTRIYCWSTPNRLPIQITFLGYSRINPML